MLICKYNDLNILIKKKDIGQGAEDLSSSQGSKGLLIVLGQVFGKGVVLEGDS
jgi:hypothetical protein